jgi:pyrroline-5-carboxylate reductase
MSKNISFIGGGNMARSLIGGLMQNHYPIDSFCVVDPNPDARAQLEQTFGVHTQSQVDANLAFADVLLLAVKPQVLKQVCAQIAPHLGTNSPLVISIVAGIEASTIDKWLGGDVSIVRAMPNTPALIGEGASALFANERVKPEQKQIAQEILDAVGISVWVDAEALLNVVTAVSGSGPAYFFKVMEIMLKWARMSGLSDDASRSLVLHTALGAATMALKSDHEVDELRRQVTSKGGTTEAALNCFQTEGLIQTIEHGLQAAHERAQSLAIELGDK